MNQIFVRRTINKRNSSKVKARFNEMVRLKSVVGLGTDIVDIRRFWKIVNGHSGESSSPSQKLNKFAKKILNEKYEYPRYLQLCGRKNEKQNSFLENKNKIVYYLAGCWAAKEAAFKSLNDEQQLGFRQFNKWYRKYDGETGRPVFWHDYGEECLQFKDNEFLISITHDHDCLVATVIRQLCIDLYR